MSVLTPARFGLARLGATRMGYPVLAGVKVPLYALFNVARLNATRFNYHSPQAFIAIDGIHVGGGRAVEGQQVDADTLSITDTLNETPNTARCTTRGFIPVEGQEVVITLGSKNNLIRAFGGRILSLRQYFTGTPANYKHDLNLIDYTWDLNLRKVRTRYTSSTVGAIAADLIATYAPGFTVQVAPDIVAEPINEITFTEQTLPGALTQLTKRVEGDWQCDYHRVVKLFYEDLSETNPTILNTVHPTLDKASWSATRDLSQILTRVYVEGGGVNAAASVGVGETILPLDGDVAWYEPTGGVVVSGPQRLRYSGTYAGGGGGLVGTGAAPTGAPILAAAPGAGLTPGTRDYAVTFMTAAGESVAGPRATITSGSTAPPSTAPTVSASTAATGPGIGPDPGPHSYAVTFETASGETTPGPLATVATGETPAPVSYPTPNAPTVGLGVDAGPHEYAVGFVTAIGETLPGPISTQVVAGALPPPVTAPTAGASTFGSGPEAGPHGYAVSLVTAAGETVPGPVATLNTGVTAPPAPAPVGTTTPWPSNVPGDIPGTRRYAVTFVTGTGETTPGPSVDVVPPACAPPDHAMDVFVPGLPPGSGNLVNGKWYGYVLTFVDPTTGAETAAGPVSWGLATNVGLLNFFNVPYIGAYYATVYRTVAQASPSGGLFYREQGPTFTTNIQQSGSMSDAVLVTKPQPSAPAYVPATRVFALSAIPLGEANVTARKVYRTEAYGSQLKLAGTLADNTTTTFSDADQVLGANAPTVNTASLNRLALLNIATGPAGVTQRKLYRTAVNASALQFLATLANNSATTYTDTTPDASLGAPAPTVNTAAMQVIPLTEIPKGESGGGVTARTLYRRSGGAGLRYLATLANNSSTTYTDTTPNASLGAAPPGVSTAVLTRFALSAIPKGDALVTARKLYRTQAGFSTLQLLATLADTTTTTFVDTVPDAGLGVAAPTSNTAVANQVALASIPIGAAAVIARKLYRTIASGAQLKLLATLADNTASTYLDALADASLGANVPTVDTSGLTQPQGNVIAGSTSLQIASIGAFPPEGWAVIGNGQQVIRYTGISGTVLTGIPASGPGSIQATIAFNSTVTAAPQLTGIPASGVGSILYAILKGDEVNLWVQVDDVDAQRALSAIRDPLNLLGGAAGIQEESLQDRRLSHREALARGAAHLARRRDVAVSLRYQVHDLNTRAGRTIRVNLGPPFNLLGVDFLIQQVQVSRFLPARYPRYDVSASAERLTFDDLLRAFVKVG